MASPSAAAGEAPTLSRYILEQLQPGASVKILFVDDGDRKEIQGIESVAPRAPLRAQNVYWIAEYRKSLSLSGPVFRMNSPVKKWL